MQETASPGLLGSDEGVKQLSKSAMAWQNALAKVQAQQEAAAVAGDKTALSGGSCQFAGDDRKNVPSIIQQHVSLPTPAAPAPPRLAVMIHTARDLPGSSSRELQRVGMYVKAAVHKRGQAPAHADKARTHLALQADGSVAWNSLLTFSPAEPSEMMLTVSLRHKRGLATVLWGVASVDLQAVMSDPAAWTQKQQLVLEGHRLQDMGAVLEVQLFLSTESIQGPLHVLAATWNVGNAVPPPPHVLLNSWLKGAAEAQHHLIAVGAQECNYSKEVRRDSSRRRPNTPDTAAPAGDTSKKSCSNQGAAAAAEPAGAAVAEATAAVEQGHAGTDTDEDPDADGVLGQDSAVTIAAVTAAVPAITVGNPGLTAVDGLKLKSTRSRVTGYLLEQVDSAAVWERHIAAALGQRYWLVCSKHMFQTRLLLFARVDVVPYVSHTTTGFEATGIGHVGLNKGGVMASLKLDNTRLAFVCSHLAAHQSKTAQRNSDVAEICAGLHLPAGSAAGAAGADVVTGFHHVVWMGDLNYRLEYGQQAITHSDSPTPEDHASLCADIFSRKYSELLKMDQLQREQMEGHVFAGFREGQIDFEPTFKVLKGRSGFHYSTKRSPAWCDRVLFKSALPHKQISCSSYYTAPETSTSDHKPVATQLSVPLVTNTVTSGRVTGSVPFKLYVASVRLEGGDSWRRLDELLVGHAAAAVEAAGGAGAAGPHRSSSLGKQRQKASARQRKLKLVLSGACLAGLRQEHPMKVNADAVAMAIDAAAAIATPIDGTKDLEDSSTHSSLLLREESMALLPGAVQDLQDDWLLLRIVLVEGLKHRTLARGVVPLQPTVAEYQARSFKPVQVPVQLECHSAAAGIAVVSLQLISSQAARQGMLEAVRRMRALTYLRTHSAIDSRGVGISKPQIMKRKNTWSESKVHGWLGGSWLVDNYARVVEGLRPLGHPGKDGGPVAV